MHKYGFIVLSWRSNNQHEILALVIPAAYHSSKMHQGGTGNSSMAMFSSVTPELDDSAENGLRIISRGTALLLLFVYVAYLIFQVCSLAKS